MSSACRSGERGAALFIVVLVVTLLTAIGVFAVHATSLAQLASGYSRHEATAFYVAELGMNLRASTIADDPDKYVFDGTIPVGGPGKFTCREAKDLRPLLPPERRDV